jgi:hypothetical protein
VSSIFVTIYVMQLLCLQTYRSQVVLLLQLALKQQEYTVGLGLQAENPTLLLLAAMLMLLLQVRSFNSSFLVAYSISLNFPISINLF